MSKLNPNAGEWVPTYVSICCFISRLSLTPFPFRFSAPAASPAKATASPVKAADPAEKAQSPVKKSEEAPASSPANSKTPLERAAEFGHDVTLNEDGEPISYVRERPEDSYCPPNALGNTIVLLADETVFRRRATRRCTTGSSTRRSIC
jgi:hypothetical protein